VTKDSVLDPSEIRQIVGQSDLHVNQDQSIQQTVMVLLALGMTSQILLFLYGSQFRNLSILASR
jgi:hypothetical protein